MLNGISYSRCCLACERPRPLPPPPCTLARSSSSPSSSCFPTVISGDPAAFFACMRILFGRTGCSTRALLSSAQQGCAMTAGGHQSCRQYHHRARRRERERESVVVIMGATGTGKSKLSIDIASRFAGEVVNSDKIQVYRGLDVTTNKIPIADRRGVPHHVLGELDPAGGELPPAGFRAIASAAIASIAARGRLPVVAGGSNSLIHALLSERYDPRADPYRLDDGGGREGLKYRCCFLWVDVEAEVLAEHLDRRVDEMVGMGMVEELDRYFAATAEGEHAGLEKAIGVPEFRDYCTKGEGSREREDYEAAVAAIKENTRRLAEAQVWKIKKLAERGWAQQRVDATGTVGARLSGAGRAAEEEAWERDVLGPSVAAVRRFLGHEAHHDDHHHARAPLLTS